MAKKIDEMEYADLLSALVQEGESYAKTTPRYAYRWPALVIHTETDAGKLETAKEIDPDFFIVFDPRAYAGKEDREKAAQDIISRFSSKFMAQFDLRDVDFKGPDVWVMEGKKFRAEYEADPLENGKYQPNDEARTSLRQCLTVAEDIEFPVQWGSFVVEKGGVIATRVSDIPALRAALAAIGQACAEIKACNLGQEEEVAQMRAAIRQHLYRPDNTTVFDVYGMKPGFLEKNYDLQPLPGRAPLNHPDRSFKGKGPTLQ